MSKETGHETYNGELNTLVRICETLDCGILEASRANGWFY
jgi:hypothetical protein